MRSYISVCDASYFLLHECADCFCSGPDLGIKNRDNESYYLGQENLAVFERERGMDPFQPLEGTAWVAQGAILLAINRLVLVGEDLLKSPSCMSP